MSDDVRGKLDAWFARQAEDALKEAPIEIDIDEFFGDVQRRGLDRLRVAGKL